jgi:hypothetical protein
MQRNHFASRRRLGHLGAGIVTCLGIVSLFGCATYTRTDAARWRAYHELACDDIHVVPRTDLSVATFEASGCGKVVLYTCTRQYHRFGYSPPACVPEAPAAIESKRL